MMADGEAVAEPLASRPAEPKDKGQTSESCTSAESNHSIVASDSTATRLDTNESNEAFPTPTLKPLPAEETADMGPSAPAWTGWAELENDPVIFSTLLREWGVRDVRVHEVVPLDAVFDSPADATLGLIFLSRYTASTHTEGSRVPVNGVWFANQTSTYSCATVALMNIINNRANIDLGPELNEFRRVTSSLSSRERGISLDGFAHIRDVHNSFSTFNDKLNVDMRLKEAARAAKTAKRKTAVKGRKGLKRKRGTSVTEEDENGFHFVAYVPAAGQVWRMDGMERSPNSLGLLTKQDNWLAMAIEDLQTQWQRAERNELEFSLLSVVAGLGASTTVEEQEAMDRRREDWGPLLELLIRLHAEKGDIREMME